MNDFDYLGPAVYLDAACQSLRPRPVVAALEEYYFEHNSCGERAKYPWSEKTDAVVAVTRRKVLKLLKLKEKDHFVSFTLNTTYGINLILNQLNPAGLEKIITSEIEHNSPFLSTMALSQKLHLPRIVLKRAENGDLIFDGKVKDVARAWTESEPDGETTLDFRGALVVVNCAANFDGQTMGNLQKVIQKVHQDGGIIIIDAAQAMAHQHEILEKTDADAICFSAHKMYSPSLGVIVAKKSLIPRLNITFIGGGMVDDVFAGRYDLSAAGNDAHIHTIFEPGLQAWGEICALNTAIDWLISRSKADKKLLDNNAQELYNFLTKNPKVHMVNSAPNPTMSFFVDGLDSHLLGKALGASDIMARTGYFCAHFYLDKVKHYPALTRFSLSYATRPEDIEKVKSALKNL